MKIIWGLMVALCLSPAACAPAISTGLQHQGGAKVNFADLAAHPEKYQGQVVILGGEVMQVEPSGPGSLMEVNQFDLDDRLYPAAAGLTGRDAKSGGTFLIQSGDYLSPAKYQPGSRITVAGEVAGRRSGLLLLKGREIHFWEGPRWEKWYYPVPREWYNYDPNLEYWFTPPYFSPWYPGRTR
jgi:starvation-inducible outer membrane lipoprotein